MMIVRIIVFYVFWNEINLNTKRKLKLKFYNTDSNFSVFANTMYLPMNAFNHKLTCLSCTHRINFQKRNYHIINFFFVKVWLTNVDNDDTMLITLFETFSDYMMQLMQFMGLFLFARYHLTNLFSKDSKILNFV